MLSQPFSGVQVDVRWKALKVRHAKGAVSLGLRLRDGMGR